MIAHFIRGYRGNNSGPIPLQVHLKWAHHLLLPTTQTSILPFEQMSKRRMNCLQESISESMHKHSFSNIISNFFSDYHHIWQRSYTSPSSNVWFFACLIIPPFKMASNIISSMLCTKLGLSHLTFHGLS